MDQGIDSTIPSGPARLLDFVFLLRPMILIPVWTFYLLGAWHGSVSSGLDIQLQSFYAGIISMTALLGAIYIINQIVDRETDRANNKLFLVSHSIIPLRAAWIEALLLIVGAFLVSLTLVSVPFALLLLLSLALGVAYSAEPLRLKRRAVLDVLSNAAGIGILNTLAGWIATGASLERLEVLAPYPFAVASVHLMTALADIEGDRACGMKTSGVTLGKKKATALAIILMATSTLIATAVGNNPAFYAALVSLPLFIIPARASQRKAGASVLLLPAKGTTLIFSVTAGFLFPLYILFIAVVIILTRVYYLKRFSMTYPSLGG